MRQWYQRVDWAKHTTVLAAVIAALGLAFTAWGTWKSAQVADDQLAQSKDAKEQQARSQVALITLWGEDEGVVVANRSLDPATAWVRLDINSPNRPFYVALGSLPPCQRVDIPFGTIQKGAEPWPVRALLVTDADGQEWERKADGTLHRQRFRPAPSTITQLETPVRFKRTALKQCGTSE